MMANGRGGSRPGAGRPKGAKSRATKQAKAQLSELAKAYAPEALDMLAQVMRSGESEAARVSAANSILDRGYGKPAQVTVDLTPEEAETLSINIGVRDAVSSVRVTKP